MSRKRAKARERRHKQKQKRKEAKKLKAIWEATPFKLRTLLSNIGFDGPSLLSIWLRFLQEKYPRNQLTTYYVRGYGTRRIAFARMVAGEA